MTLISLQNLLDTPQPPNNLTNRDCVMMLFAFLSYVSHDNEVDELRLMLIPLEDKALVRLVFY